MPRKCSIPGCKSNYNKQGKRVSIFSFPKKDLERNAWLKAIPFDLDVNKLFHGGVCIKHWKPGYPTVKKSRLESPAIPPDYWPEYGCYYLAYGDGYESEHDNLNHETSINNNDDDDDRDNKDGLIHPQDFDLFRACCFGETEFKDRFISEIGDKGLIACHAPFDSPSEFVLLSKDRSVGVHRFSVYFEVKWEAGAVKHLHFQGYKGLKRVIHPTFTNGIVKSWRQLTEIVGYFTSCQLNYESHNNLSMDTEMKMQTLKDGEIELQSFLLEYENMTALVDEYLYMSHQIQSMKDLASVDLDLLYLTTKKSPDVKEQLDRVQELIHCVMNGREIHSLHVVDSGDTVHMMAPSPDSEEDSCSQKYKENKNYSNKQDLDTGHRHQQKHDLISAFVDVLAQTLDRVSTTEGAERLVLNGPVTLCDDGVLIDLDPITHGSNGMRERAEDDDKNNNDDELTEMDSTAEQAAWDDPPSPMVLPSTSLEEESERLRQLETEVAVSVDKSRHKPTTNNWASPANQRQGHVRVRDGERVVYHSVNNNLVKNGVRNNTPSSLHPVVTSRLRRSNSSMTSDRKLICHHCGKKYNKKTCLDEHMQIHEGKMFPCPVCGKEFKTKKYLKIHQRVHMPGRRPPRRRSDILAELALCSICGRKYRSKSSLVQHIKQHEEFSKNGHLKCMQCGKQFQFERNLRIHTRRHAQTPTTCEICGKTFRYKETLKAHKLRFHQPQTSPPSSCPICGKLRFNMKAHLDTHNGLKRFHCSVCLKQFTTKASLKAHQVLHTGVYPYRCTLCNRENGFTSPFQLRRHEKLHEVYPFCCDKCGKLYKSPNSKKAKFHAAKCNAPITLRHPTTAAAAAEANYTAAALKPDYGYQDNWAYRSRYLVIPNAPM